MALFEESYTRILTLPDCHWMHREAKEEENGNPSCQLRFPALSVRENDGSTWRLLSDPCAVCLHQYQVGDSVVWSPNDKCRHVFHQHCLVRWLLHQATGSDFPCPVCRQPYCREITHPSSEVRGRRRIEEKRHLVHASPG
jgi:Ring finger domain